MSKFRLNADSLFERKEEDFKIEAARVVFLSVEGNATEQLYFKWVEKYKDQCGISSLIHVHTLHRSKKDTNSSCQAVLELLEDYVNLRDSNGVPQKLLEMVPSKYNYDFVKNYLNGNNIDEKIKLEFEDDLKLVGIDYSYNIFLRNYKGKNDNDVFGIVIDRDWCSHSSTQLKGILNSCNNNNYKFYISNPCFEFWLLLHVSDVKNDYSSCLNKFLENEKVTHHSTFTGKELNNKVNHGKSISEYIFVQKYLPNIDIAIKRAKNDFQTNTLKLIETGSSKTCDHGDLGTNLFELFELLKNDNV